MASSKRIYRSGVFKAGIFAGGVWRGAGETFTIPGEDYRPHRESSNPDCLLRQDVTPVAGTILQDGDVNPCLSAVSAGSVLPLKAIRPGTGSQVRQLTAPDSFARKLTEISDTKMQRVEESGDSRKSISTIGITPSRRQDVSEVALRRST